MKKYINHNRLYFRQLKKVYFWECSDHVLCYSWPQFCAFKISVPLTLLQKNEQIFQTFDILYNKLIIYVQFLPVKADYQLSLLVDCDLWDSYYICRISFDTLPANHLFLPIFRHSTPVDIQEISIFSDKISIQSKSFKSQQFITKIFSTYLYFQLE